MLYRAGWRGAEGKLKRNLSIELGAQSQPVGCVKDIAGCWPYLEPDRLVRGEALYACMNIESATVQLRFPAGGRGCEQGHRASQCSPYWPFRPEQHNFPRFLQRIK